MMMKHGELEQGQGETMSSRKINKQKEEKKWKKREEKIRSLN